MDALGIVLPDLSRLSESADLQWGLDTLLERLRKCAALSNFEDSVLVASHGSPLRFQVQRE